MMGIEDDAPVFGAVTRPYPKWPPAWPSSLSGTASRLIAIEGIDGSGKSTVAQAAARSLGARVIRGTRSPIIEPSLLKAKWENVDFRVQSLLYAAGLAHFLSAEVAYGASTGETIIFDRYRFSIIARSVARGIDAHWLDSVTAFAPMPKRTYILDVDPNVAWSRRLCAGGEPSYWECGADRSKDEASLRTSPSLEGLRSAFVAYQSRVREELLTLAAGDCSARLLDGHLPTTELVALIEGGVRSLV